MNADWTMDDIPRLLRLVRELEGTRDGLLDVLKDLTALYEASPGRDPSFVSKALTVIARAEGRRP
jgi:hypothetical protein